MSRYVETAAPTRPGSRDPRADDPRWQEARGKATRMAVQHFDSRQASETEILSFIHRETLRHLGEPVTPLWYGWGKTRRGIVRPEMPAKLQAQIDAAREAQWRLPTRPGGSR